MKIRTTAEGGGAMRLVIDGRFLLQDVTGVQKVAIEFVNALDSLLAEGEYPGLEVEVLAPARGALVTALTPKAVEIRRAGRLPGQAWEQVELPLLVGSAPLLCLGNLAPMASLLKPGARVYTMVHDLSYKYFPGAYSRTFRLLYNTVIPLVLARSQRVFTVSNSERAAILEQYGGLIGPERLLAVQNGGGDRGAREGGATADAAERVPVPPFAERARRCLYVGSLTRRKNAQGLVRAAIELAESTDLEFVFVGATNASFDQTGVSIPPALRDRVRTLGQVNDPDQIAAEYRKAAVFLFPSFYEASPLPPIEAMSGGCPVVSADIPSLRERCGDAALYCDPDDVASMVRQVRAVMEDTDLWQEMQARGLERAQQFSWRGQVRSVVGTILDAS